MVIVPAEDGSSETKSTACTMRRPGEARGTGTRRRRDRQSPYLSTRRPVGMAVRVDTSRRGAHRNGRMSRSCRRAATTRAALRDRRERRTSCRLWRRPPAMLYPSAPWRHARPGGDDSRPTAMSFHAVLGCTRSLRLAVPLPSRVLSQSVSTVAPEARPVAAAWSAAAASVSGNVSPRWSESLPSASAATRAASRSPSGRT